MEIGRVPARLDDGARELHAALAALREHLGEREPAARLFAVFREDGKLLVAVRREAVDRHDDRHAELLHVLHVGREVHEALFERVRVGDARLRLGHAAVIFEGAHRRHEHHRRRGKPRVTAFDVHELLRAQVGAEARLGDRVVGELEGQAGRAHRVAAVRDVRERPAVHERGGVLERLHEVRLERVL